MSHRWRAVLALVLTMGVGISPVWAEVMSLMQMSADDILKQLVVVASQKEETLAEVPVITSIITDREIKRMGARTLNDVLLTLPGFSRIQDHNEYYSAERGIYASSQQKILVLRDGHRLNSRAYSEANFGPAISLDNIKRIEVMRGPGATLYGDVALTAVVNIVTYNGKDINGGNVTVGAGNFGQKKLAINVGNDLGQGRDIAFFASLYQSDGEKKTVDASRDYSAVPQAGEVVLDRFSGAYPAYDMGLKYTTGDLEFSLSHRYDHYTMPRGGGGGYGQLIDVDSFRAFEGEGIGSSSEFGHYEVKYSPTLGKNTLLTVRPYLDTFTFRDNEPQRRTDEPGSNGINPKSYFMKWLERSYGIQNSVSQPYSFLGSASLLAGMQVEEMDLYDSWDVHSPDPTHTDWYMPTTKVLRPGKEQSYAVYVQDKHYLSSKFITNLGVRYDYKMRLTGKDVEGFSPRAALIYLPNNTYSFRASYGKSFVDAPYWYRYNQMGGGYAGGPTLRPEWLQTYQFTATANTSKHVFNQLNLFLNEFNDVVYRSAAGVYSNAGVIKTDGAEYELGLRWDNLSARANYTYQYTYDCIGYGYKDGMIANVPMHMGNIIVDYAPLARSTNDVFKNLWVNIDVHVVGQQFAPYGVSPSYAGQNLNNMNPAYTLYNLGLNFENFFRKDLALRVHVYNLTDEQYYQGGSVNLPYEEPGRWYLAQLTYSW